MNLDDFEVGDRIHIVVENMCGAELEYVGKVVETPPVENPHTGEERDVIVYVAEGDGKRKAFKPSEVVEVEKTDQKRLDSF
jgi:hypothetical protein